MAYGAVENKSSAASATTYDNASTSSIITSDNVQGAIDDLFTSVSNGKSLIASAITDKGISTSVTDSWETIAGNIINLGNKNVYINNNIYVSTRITTNPWYTPVLNFQPQNIILLLHEYSTDDSIACYISEIPILYCIDNGMEIDIKTGYADRITIIKENNQIGLLTDYTSARSIQGNYFLLCYD